MPLPNENIYQKTQFTGWAKAIAAIIYNFF